MFKFSTSPSRSGFLEIINTSPKDSHVKGIMSLYINIG
jgi:hypothetical protein